MKCRMVERVEKEEGKEKEEKEEHYLLSLFLACPLTHA
jgi:hypothetical protein